MPSTALSGEPLARPSFAAIFPLRLSLFESFLLADDRPDYPAMCDLQMRLKGRIDRPAFEAGLRVALARNPLFSATIQPGPDGRQAWAPADRQPALNWQPANAPLGNGYGAYVDLRSQVGLKVYVRADEDAATVLLHFHHACSDALGGLNFIEDLLAGYAAALSSPGSAVGPRGVDPRRLLCRGSFATQPVGLGQRLRGIPGTVKDVVRFFALHPDPLAVPSLQPVAPARPNGVSYVTHSLTETAVTGLRLAASGARVSLNDLLLRDAFLALRSWNSQHGLDSRRSRLRIMMPTSLRDRDDKFLPAANRMSFAFLTRKSETCDQPADLLRSIQEGTEQIRRRRLGLVFLGVVGLADRFRFGLPRLCRLRQCLATAVVTNLGDPTRRFATRFPRVQGGVLAGNLVLEGITGVPHLRPLTRAVLCITTSADQLTISAKCDPHHFSLDDTRAFLAGYVARLEESSGCSSSDA